MPVTTHRKTHSVTQHPEAQSLRKIQTLINHQTRLCEQMEELVETHIQPINEPLKEPVELWEASRPKVPEMVDALIKQIKQSS